MMNRMRGSRSRYACVRGVVTEPVGTKEECLRWMCLRQPRCAVGSGYVWKLIDRWTGRVIEQR